MFDVLRQTATRLQHELATREGAGLAAAGARRPAGPAGPAPARNDIEGHDCGDRPPGGQATGRLALEQARDAAGPPTAPKRFPGQ